MVFDKLIASIQKEFSGLIETLENRNPPGSLALPRAARLPVTLAIHQKIQQPVLFLTGRSDHGLVAYEELGLWAPHLNRLLFPEPNPSFYEKNSWGDQVRRERLIALTSLAAYHIPGNNSTSQPPIIIAPVRAIMARTLPRRDFLIATKTIKAGQRIPLETLARSWSSLGYSRTNTVITTGQYARRGGILDIWPAASSTPTRIEFFGDEIESLRPFDPNSQRTIRQADVEDRLMISPAREFILGENDLKASMEDNSEFTEFSIPTLHPMPASLIDYLPANALVFIDDWQNLQNVVEEIEQQAIENRQTALRDGLIADDFPTPYLTWAEILDSLAGQSCLELGYPAASQVLEEASGENEALPGSMFSPGQRFAGRLKPFNEHIRHLASQEEAIFVVSRQKPRLEELWQEQFLDGNGFGEKLTSSVTFIQGSLTEGWRLQSAHGPAVNLFTDSEIFGLRPPELRTRKQISSEDPEASYADLQPGDRVVHIDHGIGIFVGLVNRTIDKMEREYLCVEYANEAQLFVPVYQADRLTRYVGPDSRAPGLSHLGGTEWRTAKAGVKDAVVEVAQDLLELYARRSYSQGFAFTGDSHWQGELEASFPYLETEDQIRVLKEVKADMEKARPMDRLICGDVGYGKTEVALRAAFKCVMDGKQVAILVPTTILAQQHLETFRQRLSAFPIVVEMLSRFRTPQEQQEIVRKLLLGKVDILIGTHRLLSSDVQFKDLGLLVIDEEQRFGVTHKEKLKQLRNEVDVLTLTATPIPRTLYMALTGVRDISTINTPPEERLPVITHVGPYSPDLVRRSILREIERGGQIFFVHNRVHTIHAMLTHLEKLVPEARIAIAHGQMAENELSKRMELFTEGEVDVLLTTSIIESGLDIPNANTLIVDRADTFGLAQLYQLRGRVGRGAQRAYAYFFRHRQKQPTVEGQQRLETIAENTQLGAGYSIAMRDLEIRGTGDILGVRQSGHVAAVGFHLYTRLLSGAVTRLRRSGTPIQIIQTETPSPESSLAINVDLPMAVNIPPSYVPEKGMRLRLYRRLADVRSLDDVDRLSDEFGDRFGALPEAVTNLLYQLKVKIKAEEADLSAVSVENGQLVLRFPEGQNAPFISGLHPSARIGKSAIWLPYLLLEDWQAVLLDCLDQIAKERSIRGNAKPETV